VAQSRPAVAIVGAGPVAQALGWLMAAGGEPIVALASRTRLRAEQAARFISGPGGSPAGSEKTRPTPVDVAGSEKTRPTPVDVRRVLLDPPSRLGPAAVVPVVDISELPQLATRVLIAVSDQAIEPVAEALASAGMRSGAVLHTCGARGPDALRALRVKGVACGMLHPLQTIMTAEQGVNSLAGATFGLSGDPEAALWGDEIVEIIRMVAGGDGRSLHIAADRSSHYHAGAVMASNALLAVLDAAMLLMAHAGVGREAASRAIAPLARTSLQNALASGPLAALTGPVVRGDASTVAAHTEALRDVEPTVAKLYEASAMHLLQLARQRGLSDASVRAVESVLDKRSG
jgi:predicted short-subunit dehydrogenase-like oxidoreductase (DUF2520 family)